MHLNDVTVPLFALFLIVGAFVGLAERYPAPTWLGVTLAVVSLPVSFLAISALGLDDPRDKSGLGLACAALAYSLAGPALVGARKATRALRPRSGSRPRTTDPKDDPKDDPK